MSVQSKDMASIPEEGVVCWIVLGYRFWLTTIFIFTLSCGNVTLSVGEPVNLAEKTEDAELRDFLENLVSNVVRYPTSPIHRGRLAMAYDANQFTTAAISTYSQASQLDDGDMRWPYLQALSEASLGRLEDAIETMSVAIERDREYLPSYLAMSFWLMDSGQYTQACKTLEESVTQIGNADSTMAWQVAKIQCLLETGELKQARSLVENLPDRELPSYANLVKRRVMRMSGEMDLLVHDEAETNESSKMTWSDPIAGAVVEYTHGLSSETILAKNLIDGGRAGDAIPLIESLLDRHPNKSQLHELHGAAYVRLGQVDQGIIVLQEAVTKFPKEHLLWFNLARLLESEGDVESALRHYVTTLNLRDDFVPALNAYTRILITKERFQEARDLLAKTHDVHELDEQNLYLLGVLEGELGNWRKASSRFSEVTQLNSENVNAYAKLALSLNELGNKEEATQAIDRAIAIDPDDENVLLALEVMQMNNRTDR